MECRKRTLKKSKSNCHSILIFSWIFLVRCSCGKTAETEQPLRKSFLQFRNNCARCIIPINWRFISYSGFIQTFWKKFPWLCLKSINFLTFFLKTYISPFPWPFLENQPFPPDVTGLTMMQVNSKIFFFILAICTALQKLTAQLNFSICF